MTCQKFAVRIYPQSVFWNSLGWLGVFNLSLLLLGIRYGFCRLWFFAGWQSSIPLVSYFVVWLWMSRADQFHEFYFTLFSGSTSRPIVRPGLRYFVLLISL